jgi:hypothetical protein
MKASDTQAKSRVAVPSPSTPTPRKRLSTSPTASPRAQRETVWCVRACSHLQTVRRRHVARGKTQSGPARRGGRAGLAGPAREPGSGLGVSRAGRAFRATGIKAKGKAKGKASHEATRAHLSSGATCHSHASSAAGTHECIGGTAAAGSAGSAGSAESGVSAASPTCRG